jgi:fructose-specific phosphotransferase system IIC component
MIPITVIVILPVTAYFSVFSYFLFYFIIGKLMDAMTKIMSNPLTQVGPKKVRSKNETGTVLLFFHLLRQFF